MDETAEGETQGWMNERVPGKDIRFILYPRALESGGLRRTETTCRFGTRSLQIRDADPQVVAEGTVPVGGLVSPEIPSHPTPLNRWGFSAEKIRICSLQVGFPAERICLPKSASRNIRLDIGTEGWCWTIESLGAR